MTATATGTSKSIKFNEQNNNSARASCFFVHFFAVSAQLQREILGWLENGNGKVIITFSLLTRTRSPLFSSNLTSLLSSNWVTWCKNEKGSKDAKSIFQQRFHWRRRFRIVRSLKADWTDGKSRVVLSALFRFVMWRRLFWFNFSSDAHADVTNWY